jgi:uncharacterized protein YndB with AHSA1/START domain
METTFTPDIKAKTLRVERVFKASPEKVWQAWTTPELFEKWWGPRGWTTTVKHQELRPEGYMLYGMKCEDPGQTDWYGKVSWGKSVYQTIDEPKSLRYIDYFCDSEGVVDETMPPMDITVEFVPEDGATRLVSTGVFQTSEDLKKVLEMGMEPGLRQTWDRLAETVEA